MDDDPNQIFRERFTEAQVGLVEMLKVVMLPKTKKSLFGKYRPTDEQLGYVSGFCEGILKAFSYMDNDRHMKMTVTVSSDLFSIPIKDMILRKLRCDMKRYSDGRLAGESRALDYGDHSGRETILKALLTTNWNGWKP